LPVQSNSYFFVLGRRPPNAAAATLLTLGEVRLLRSNLLALRATLSDVLGFTFFAIEIPPFVYWIVTTSELRSSVRGNEVDEFAKIAEKLLGPRIRWPWEFLLWKYVR